MSEVYSIVECRVDYNDGTFEIRRPTFSQIATGMAMVNTGSVKDYVRETSKKMKSITDIRVLDVWYFNNADDYNKYLKTH